MQLSRKTHLGFTLAELLIALAILGVIATFTIPKILSSQQNTKYNALAKESASTVAAAYTQYKLTNTVSTATGIANITPYMNYLSVDTSSTIDDKYSLASVTCAASRPCLKLANGSMLLYTTDTFDATNSTNALSFYIDPNGAYGGTTNGPDKSVQFFIYYPGRVTSRGNSDTNTMAGGVTYASPDPTLEPPWFTW